MTKDKPVLFLWSDVRSVGIRPVRRSSARGKTALTNWRITFYGVIQRW